MQPDLGAKQLPLFAYLPDSYEGPELPEAGPAGAVTLFHRSVTDEFDDKRSLARKMQAAGCEGAFAPSFLTVEAALKDTSWRSSRADEDLFFVKPSCGSGGRGIRVLNREQLSRESIDEEQCVVQRAVQDIETIEGRKFVLRFYLVIHDGAIFMHRRGVVIVHDAPYEQSSANYDVQVCHDGMHEAGSGELLRAMHLQPDGERWREAIRRRVQEIYCGLQPIVQASSKSLYTIIGGDALIESTGEARLIELNFYPNLGSQNGVLNADVKQPMLRDALSQVLLGVPTSELELVLPPELV
ncbi:unnamed protein product [Polarella glacialis]|uniref:Uncharacterized protein n=1 Tax=Polarella glacialis TaxID=89957 RepID=A0A813G674_POLGL|nr:unnamed protein product [Polarella glacialis]CAE8618359.1 unnamed protein product [Polarella glacialis]